MSADKLDAKRYAHVFYPERPVMKRHYFPTARALPVAAFAMLASCGGGYDGGSTTYTPPAATPAATTPPAAMPPPSATTEQYSATLNAGSEVPPNLSAATGTATLTVDTVTRSMTGTVTTTGISGIAAHIHEGVVGVSGPIIFPLSESYAGSGVWSTTVTISDAQLATLRAGNYYFNVHSAIYPNGEIRGQIRP
jgi:hypothetical protein